MSKKYVCIKSLFGKIYSTWMVITQLLEEGSNFCIPEGKIVFIIESSDYIDVYETEDYQKGWYFREQPGREVKDYFMPFAEWREQQIKSVLDD